MDHQYGLALKAPDAKPDDLSPGIHAVEGENQVNSIGMETLGKETSCHHISLKKYVSSKKHEELLPRENNWPRFYSCQAFLETRQNELRNSRSPHV